MAGRGYSLMLTFEREELKGEVRAWDFVDP
jgi:hypothetical protein